MKITIISVGKIKEKFFCDAISEYSKRLSKYCKLSEEVVQDEKADDNFSQAEIEQVKIKEGIKILNKIRPNTYSIILDISGNLLTSLDLSKKIYNLGVTGHSDITFIIGGSNGLSNDVINRANYRLSFSKLTFPHQLFKVILLEQIYRSFKIISNEPYHK